MALGRGFVVTLLFAVGWLALAFYFKPPVLKAGADDSAIHANADAIDRWTFTPALVTDRDRAGFDAARDWTQAGPTLVSIDEALGARLAVSALLTLVGLAGFWAGIGVVAQKKSLPLGVALIALGPALPCIVARGTAGFLFSGPPLACGFVIAAITLVSKRFEKTER
jgi:hypothetical protein